MGLEGRQLTIPELLDVAHPILQLIEGLASQTVDPNASIILGDVLLDETTLAQDPQVAAQPGGRQFQTACEIARSVRLVAQQFDHRATSRIGQSTQRSVELAQTG